MPRKCNHRQIFLQTSLLPSEHRAIGNQHKILTLPRKVQSANGIVPNFCVLLSIVGDLLMNSTRGVRLADKYSDLLGGVCFLQLKRSVFLLLSEIEH